MSSRRQDNGNKRRRGRRQRRHALPTPAMIEATREQVAASCRGDATVALEAYGRRGHPPGQCMQHELGFIDRLGADAPDWLMARWALSTAVGWMLGSGDPRVEEAARAIALTHEPPPDDRFAELEALVCEVEQRDDVNQDGPTRTDDLVGAGVPEPVADSIAVCEFALLLAQMSRDGADAPALELAAANAASNLWYPPIVDGVREHATPPDSGPLWRDVAACVAEPFRSVCIGFAGTAEAKSRAA